MTMEAFWTRPSWKATLPQPDYSFPVYLLLPTMQARAEERIAVL